MKKRLLTIILAGVMVCSLAACGGDKPSEDTDSATGTTADSDNTITADSATSDDTKEEKTTTTDGADESVASSVMVYYGWGSEDEEKYTSEIFCPEGAVFSEKTLEIYEEDGSVMTVEVDDEVNEYSATSSMHWHRDAYNNEPTDYPIIAQLYFDGELDAETAAEYSGCSQQVTPLGFKWEGHDVIMIETKYTFKDYGEQTELFVGVEYDLDYWKAEEGTGEIKDLTTKALFGFDMYSYGMDELTQDKCAWIIGELFNVDSGIANPFATSDEETPAPVANVDASELYGTWLQRDSDWDNTFIFNADGTGVMISGPEYPFNYTVNDNVLTLNYDDGDMEELTVSVSGDLMTLVDVYGNELLLDKQADDADDADGTGETVEIPTELIGTWTNEDGTETYAFNGDGSGYQNYEGEEYGYTYKVSDDRIYLSYDNGSEDNFSFYVDEDKLVIMNSWIYIRQ